MKTHLTVTCSNTDGFSGEEECGGEERVRIFVLCYSLLERAPIKPNGSKIASLKKKPPLDRD